MTLLLRNVEIDGRVVDVRVQDDTVAELGSLPPMSTDEVIDGNGGALLPGLHDHHVHLLALAAARASVDCSSTTGLESLAGAAGSSWVRGVGYDELVAGHLDRDTLDRLVPDRPVRIQHRSGALWMLNSRALSLVSSALDWSADVERDERGQPTGRLWRYDERLRSALPAEPPDLGEVARLLASFGITGVTDATPELDGRAVALIAEGIAPRAAVTLLGATGDLPPGLHHGPHKLLLRDHDLPTFDELRSAVAEQRQAGRGVAVHCVTRESLLLTLAVLRTTGALPGDRIEHAAVVPEGVAADVAALEVAVVTQPSFLRLRGDAYRREVSADDVPCLYPYASLLDANVRVAPSSDAPYGDLDPWRSMRDSVERQTEGGYIMRASEAVSAQTALAGYLSPADDPGGAPRRIQPGAAADLCLLHAPLEVALASPSAEFVRHTLTRGVITR